VKIHPDSNKSLKFEIKTCSSFESVDEDRSLIVQIPPIKMSK